MLARLLLIILVVPTILRRAASLFNTIIEIVVVGLRMLSLWGHTLPRANRDDTLVDVLCLIGPDPVL